MIASVLQSRATGPVVGPSRTLVALLVSLCLVTMASCGSDTAVETDTAAEAPQASATESAAAVDAYPDLVLETTAGSTIDFNSLEGSDTVLWFWAPW